jgi:phosphosulfolactate synthase (CoM biosynthesis protein A)
MGKGMLVFQAPTTEKEGDIVPTEETKARNTAYKNKWIAENKERVNLVVDRGRKAEVQSHAQERGESLNGFVNRAIDETIERDKQTGGA